MFSIAAINDVDVSRSHWEPLAPTKEAQEFRLTQMYQEGLLQLQAGEYIKAQKLLQAIIQDPLCIKAEAENLMSFGPMLQLRFLAFKNLAEAFFKQGSNYYKDALQCFLQAVSIDGKDVALWNRLGTLACSLGSLNIARRAFEQGLHCSPNHWGCMEKLVEVLIAIGDEVACLSVVRRLLKISPSHPRAQLISRVIEENVDIDERKEDLQGRGSPQLRGIDKLKPQHYNLYFPKKRKSDDSKVSEGSSKRKNHHKIFLNLREASWTELISMILSTLKEANRKGFLAIPDQNGVGSEEVLTVKAASSALIANASVTFSLRKYDSSEVEMIQSPNERNRTAMSCTMVKEVIAGERQSEQLSVTSPMACDPTACRERAMEFAEEFSHEKRSNLEATWGIGASGEIGPDRTCSLKERDASTDEEPPLERRSTRLERIRTRKFDKSEELENTQSELGKSKDSCEVLRRLFEPFIVCKENLENIPPLLSNNLEVQKSEIVSDGEEREVLRFLREYVVNSGLYHIAQGLLERISLSIYKPLESWTGLAELEKSIRNGAREQSMLCSLFLAEVYMDLATSATDECEVAGYLQDCEYYLCRVLDSIAVTIPSSGVVWDNMPGAFKNLDSREPDKTEADQRRSKEGRSSEHEMRDNSWPFWVRFYWVSGRARYFQGSCEKGREDFQKCLAVLEAREQVVRNSANISLPHCKVDKEISVESVRHKLYELQIQDLLKHSAAQMLEQGQHADLIELLAPILFSEEDREKGSPLLGVGKKQAVDFSTELMALNMLVCACERSKPRNLTVALQCYERRLGIFCQTAGFANLKGAGNPLYIPTQDTYLLKSHQGQVSKSGDWLRTVAEEVKLISRCVSDLGQIIDESACSIPDEKLLGRMQQILLTVMCLIVMMLSVRRCSGSASSDGNEQLESSCFVDAAVAFCRLQHFHSATSIKKQVELLVTVHDLLAERGLCCAGKACEGGEGVFLKMAIKHLLALEMKLKSGINALTCLNKEQLSPDKVQDSILSSATHKDSRSIMDESNNRSKIEEGREHITIFHACSDGLIKVDEGTMKESRVVGFEEAQLDKRRKADISSSYDEETHDVEKRKMELGLDIALDQSFFCLYGLNLRGGLDSTGQDGLAVHANTSLGDYQTKEQCAGVFQYLLPYARVCTKACLLKLRKVLRAIRKQFPEPPARVLENNAVDAFLEDLEFDEDKLSDMVLCSKDIKEILSYALKAPSHIPFFLEGQSHDEPTSGLAPVQMDAGVAESEGSAVAGSLSNNAGDGDCAMSGPYCEVYGNLYYLLTQVEEMCASDKWPGFVFTKEGEDFVEQNVKLFKYDLLYNPLRFESWHKLANLYDEEVDLMLNDGSKTCNATEWQKNMHLTKRVETGRRRTRRCLLMSLALVKTPEQRSQVHELLALVYYDTLQNVAPSYNQRQHVAVRNASWRMVCQKSLMHFEKALLFKPEWMHLFYLGKLCEKLGQPCERALSYYKKAAEMNPSAVDPLYRIHASRLKLLCSGGTQCLNVIQVVARYCYLPSTKEKVSTLLQDSQSGKDGTKNTHVMSEIYGDDDSKALVGLEEKHVREAWNLIFEDCVKALEVCIEGELKHYHKARFRLAQGLLSRNDGNDIERAKEELAFCFKSNRSLFTINMWEIDGSTKRNRRKPPGSTGSRRGLEISMPESSRKFITCLRKYLLLYLHLCEKTCDICTLERAYYALRVDKKFSLCLADMINVALGKYIHTLGAAICHAGTAGSNLKYSLKSLLEKYFNLFMDHGSSWSDIANVSLAEAGLSSAAVVSEGSIYGYIHRYLYSLESDNKVDVLESVNEKIRKRFKSPKLVNAHCAQVCGHAALAWCRALCCSLSAITPLSMEKSVAESGSEGPRINISDQLVVELCSDELMTNPYEAYYPSLSMELLKQSSPVSSMRGVRIKQAFLENMEKASVLLRQTFTFYRDCAGPFPVGINLFLIPSGTVAMSANEVVTNNLSSGSLVGVDLSVPRKLLLWAYNLVHGRACSIAEAVRFCEDQAKNKMKKGPPAQQSSSSICQERTLGSGNKEGSSGCQQFNNSGVVEDKEKTVLEEHDASGVGSSIVPSIYGDHPCSSTMGLSKQFSEELTQAEESSGTLCFEYVEPEKEHPH